MTVWVVHPISWPLDAALQYGAVRYINGRYIHGDELSPVIGKLPIGHMTNMENAADAFSRAADYLLIAGDHLQLVQMAALLAKRHSEFRVLRYDRIAQGYFPATIGV